LKSCDLNVKHVCKHFKISLLSHELAKTVVKHIIEGLNWINSWLYLWNCFVRVICSIFLSSNKSIITLLKKKKKKKKKKQQQQQQRDGHEPMKL
jgi:rRNA processing protein Krr1/Pno1